MSRPLVIDTNIVLDLFVFDDPAVRVLKDQIERGAVQWLATAAMRAELARVLGYPNIVRWLDRHGSVPAEAAQSVLERFDAMARQVSPAPAAAISCRDPHDQIFIDLAAAHDAALISKDRAVLNASSRAGRAGWTMGTI